MAVSQLKRLKASLKENGIIGAPASKKQRKNKDHNAYTRRKREEALESIRQAFNPFDTKVNRQKQDVINRNTQGAQGKPTLTRQMEIDNLRAAKETRKARQNRVGGLIDRRFGENNPSLSYEDKMLERFTREHQSRSSKKSLFNIDDDDDNDSDDEARFVGKYGKGSLADDFDEGDLGIAEGDEEGQAAYEARKSRNFDEDMDIEGAEPEAQAEVPERKKTKSEVMKEVIAKSKAYKYERQQAKMEDLEVMDELDDEETIKELMSELQTVKSSSAGTKSTVINDADDTYEQVIREMTFDRRAQPSDRTLTEEEKAKAEKEKLEQLEKERLARMAGDYENDDGVEDLGLSDHANEESGSENENDAAQFGFPAIDPEFEVSSDAEEDGAEIDSDSDSSEAKKSLSASAKMAASETSESIDIPCPQTLEDFMIVLSTHPIHEQPAIIKKVQKLYDPSKAEGNKKKLGKMTVGLVDYICWLAGEKPREIAADSKAFNELVSQLKTLSESYPEKVSEGFRKRLEEYSLESLAVLDLSDIFLFMLIGVLFSTSDHYHLVSTTAELLIAGWSLRNPSESEKDICTGLLLVKTLIAYQRISKRYMPEVIYFLYQALAVLLPQDVQKDTSTESESSVHDIYTKSSTFGRLAVKDAELKAVTKDNVFKLSNYAKVSKKHRPVLLALALTTLESAMDLWRDLSAFVEIFTPFSQVLAPFSNKGSLIKHLNNKLGQQLKFAKKEKKPLLLQDHRPIPLQTRAPKFEENYSLDKKSYDLDRDVQEQQKLRAEFKKEKKAVLRDIRKESRFEAQEKLKERIATDDAYHKKLARIERSIATEEGTEKNRYEREKRRR